MASVLELDFAARDRSPAISPARSTGRIITVGNLKGGTGKSTVAVNLACAMAGRGRSVLLVDCDPQATSLRWLSSASTVRWYSDLEAIAMPVECISAVESWLLRARAYVDRHDVVIVDLPAVLTPALAAAFLLSHVILVPVAPTAVDVDGTERVLRYVRTTREERPDAMPKVMLVPTRVGRRHAHGRRLERMLSSLHERVGPSLRERGCFSDAFQARSWVGVMAPGSPGHAEVMVLEAAVSELLGQAPDPPLLHKMAAAIRVRDDATPLETMPEVAGPAAPRRPWWRRWIEL